VRSGGHLNLTLSESRDASCANGGQLSVKENSVRFIVRRVAIVLLFATSAAHAGNVRDGSHDFDFEIGLWKTHIHRLVHPLTGSTTWADYDGTSDVRKIWGGKANLVELVVHGPAGHIEGLSLRLYNPLSHQWSLNFANSANGEMGVPTVGEFKNGIGTFYDWERIGDRMVLVRNVWSDITANSGRFEQAFSDDGGKTWEVNWIATDTRIKQR